MAKKAKRSSRRTKTRKLAATSREPKKPAAPADLLLDDLREMVSEARQGVAQAANSALSILYWRVGQRIRQDILKEKRAEYGEEIVPTLSAQLVADFGRSFTTRNLFHMTRFAEVFPDVQIVYSLSTQLSWTHFRDIIALDDPPRELLLKKLHEARLAAQARLERQAITNGKRD